MAQPPRIALLAIVVPGIARVQVTAVCVWPTMVLRGTVFSRRAFRFVGISLLICGPP